MDSILTWTLFRQRVEIEFDYLEIYTLLGIIMAGKSGGFGLSPPHFSRRIIFPTIIKPAESAFWDSGGMGHDTLHVAFNMLNKHI